MDVELADSRLFCLLHPSIFERTDLLDDRPLPRITNHSNIQPRFSSNCYHRTATIFVVDIER